MNQRSSSSDVLSQGNLQALRAAPHGEPHALEDIFHLDFRHLELAQQVLGVKPILAFPVDRRIPRGRGVITPGELRAMAGEIEQTYRFGPGEIFTMGTKPYRCPPSRLSSLGGGSRSSCDTQFLTGIYNSNRSQWWELAFPQTS